MTLSACRANFKQILTRRMLCVSLLFTMLETPHVIVGAAIATKIVNPMLSIPLAFASHFILDMTPHWNPHLNTETKKHGRVTTKTFRFVVMDIIVALAAGSFFAYLALPNVTHAAVILIASFASVLPDVVEGPYFFLGWKTRAIENWIKFQKSIQNDTNVYLGITIQLLTILAAFWWVFG